MQTINPSALKLLKKEIETMGEQINAEQLERKADLDRLSIELEAILRTLEAALPGFNEHYERNYDEVLREPPKAEIKSA